MAQTIYFIMIQYFTFNSSLIINNNNKMMMIIVFVRACYFQSIFLFVSIIAIIEKENVYFIIIGIDDVELVSKASTSIIIKRSEMCVCVCIFFLFDKIFPWVIIDCKNSYYSAYITTIKDTFSLHKQLESFLKLIFHENDTI